MSKAHMTKEAMGALAKAAKAGDKASQQALENAGFVLVTSNQPKDAPLAPELLGYWHDGRPRRMPGEAAMTSCLLLPGSAPARPTAACQFEEFGEGEREMPRLEKYHTQSGTPFAEGKGMLINERIQ